MKRSTSSSAAVIVLSLLLLLPFAAATAAPAAGMAHHAVGEAMPAPEPAHRSGTKGTAGAPMPGVPSADSIRHTVIRGGEPADTLLYTSAVDTARLKAVGDSMARAGVKPPKALRPRFVPDPRRALWLSLVLPGAGQIYNRKYWKLPIIYGGFLGCAYALMWNQQMYRDYSQAYLDIMDDDPNTHSYLDMLPPRYDITGREEQFKQIFKRKKDYYRRYRDLSAFCFIGVYLISVIDAYVDAQLSVFDISPDLSMRLEPAVISTGGLTGTQRGGAYGIGCSLNF